MAIQRKPLQKAPVRDIVESFISPAPDVTATPALSPAPAPAAEPEPAEVSAPVTATTAPPTGERGESTSPEREASPAQPRNDDDVEPERQEIRRGAGRPRSKRRMEPFSSKIEIKLRDEVDYYLAVHGGTMVDFMDAALRAQLKR